MSRMRGRATYRGVLWLDRIRYCLERPDSKATNSAGAVITEHATETWVP